MPFVSATLCADPSSSLTARAVLALTDLTEKVLFVEVKITSSSAGETQELRYARDRLLV